MIQFLTFLPRQKWRHNIFKTCFPCRCTDSCVAQTYDCLFAITTCVLTYSAGYLLMRVSVYVETHHHRETPQPTKPAIMQQISAKIDCDWTHSICRYGIERTWNSMDMHCHYDPNCSLCICEMIHSTLGISNNVVLVNSVICEPTISSCAYIFIIRFHAHRNSVQA